MAQRQPAVYMMSNRPGGTLYIGVTANLVRRVWQHKNPERDPGDRRQSFTDRYGLRRLVWFEQCPDMKTAIQREKQLKCWRRSEKIQLIELRNPRWRDLWLDIVG